MQFVVILVVLAAVVVFISGPLRSSRALRSASEQAAESVHAADLGDLEAAREAKYREIRDAELDHLTGKLSDDDYHALDGTLRAEALEILDALERAQADSPATIPS